MKNANINPKKNQKKSNRKNIPNNPSGKPVYTANIMIENSRIRVEILNSSQPNTIQEFSNN